MPVDEPLSELLLRWEELKDEGKPASPEELCRDCPQLLSELKRRIRALEAMNPVLDTTLHLVPEGHKTDRPETSPSPVRPPNYLEAYRTPIVAGYEILGELGRGGMGVVYKARHLRLNRVVALKMVLAGAHAGTEQRTRFRIEAEAVARLQHPNIVQIYEVGEQEGTPYIALEFIDGPPLDDVLTGRPEPPRAGAALVETLARAMHFAHQRGIVHRDLKPGNVLLTSAALSTQHLTLSTPKITDFGLAKRLDDSTRQTRTGIVMGTPSYMAPEQAAGRSRDIGPATDVYALGAILYELMTGQPPFDAASGIDCINKVLSEDPRPPSALRAGLPRDLQTICLKALEKEPGKRYATAGDLADDLRRYLDNEPIHARPVRPIERAIKWARRRPTAAALLLVSVLATLALLVGGWGAFLAVYQANEATQKEAHKSNEAVIGLHVVNGGRFLSNGDLFESLVWFARALQLDNHDERHPTHRTRLAAVLQQCPRLRQMWFHDRGVNDVAFNKLGTRVITAGDDYTARIWDTATGDQVGAPLPHERPVLQVIFSPDGTRAATASEDKTARVWDAATGKPVTPPLPHKGTVFDVQFRPDGSQVVTASADGTAQIWDAKTGKPVGPPLEHAGPVVAASFDKDGNHVLTASEDRTARVWDAATGLAVGMPLRHEGPLTDARFSPDGLRVATASDDRTARIWDAATGKALTQSLTHHGAVASAAFSPDGKQVVTAGADLLARVWDTETGMAMAPSLKHTSALKGATFSPDGKQVVTCSADHTARVWDVATGRPLTPPLAHNGAVQAAVFSPDGRSVATASDDSSARRYDVAPRGPFLPPFKHDGPILWASFSPDGKRVVTASADKTARVWDATTALPVTSPLQHQGTVVQATFDKAGRRVLTASSDGTAQVWDAATGNALLPSPLKHKGALTTAEFNPDGTRIITASTDCTARIWNAATGGEVCPPLHHQGAILDAEFSPDGSRVVTGSADDTAQVWDAATGKPVLPAPLRHNREVLQVAFSPDGKRVVTAGTDNLAQIWDSSTGARIGARLQHAGPVRDATFGPDGQHVITASDDSTGRVWDLQERKLQPPLRHRGPILRCRFSPDGQWVVTASDDNTGRVWVAETGAPLTPRLEHAGWGRITYATFGPDPHRVLTASADGTAQLWDLGPDDRPAADLERLAHLLAGCRIDADRTSMVPLDAARMRELWTELRAKYPGEFGAR